MARNRTFTTGEAIHVEGLRESIKGLRDLDKELPKIVSKTNRELTKTIMLPAARSRWRAQNIRPSQAVGVIKTSGSTAGAGIKLRSDSEGKFPFAAGVEFGSLQFKQFKPWRGNRFTVAPGTSTGYVVQDAIRDNLDTFQKRWVKEVYAAMTGALNERS